MMISCWIANHPWTLLRKLREETILSISQLQKVFTDQIVTIKATIKRLSGVKKVAVGESSIDKKDLTVVDLAASIRVVLLGDYRKKEDVKDNTYIFKCFRSDQTSL